MKRLAAIALALLTIPSIAAADPVVMQWKGTGSGLTVSIAGIGSVFAGELKWTLDGAVDILSYCVDINNVLGNSQTATPESITNLTGSVPDTGKKIAWLYNSYAPTAHGNDLLAASLQVAIWELIGGNSFTLNASSALVGASAAALIGSIGDYAASDATWLNVDLRTFRGQDQVTRSVPEPGTLLLLGAGALALASRRRLTRRAT